MCVNVCRRLQLAPYWVTFTSSFIAYSLSLTTTIVPTHSPLTIYFRVIHQMPTKWFSFSLLSVPSISLIHFSYSSELVQRTLPDHMETCTQSHLLLSMTRIQEQQNVIISLNRRVNDLEKKTGQHVTQIATLVASVAAASAAVEESEKRVTKSFQYDLQKLDQKTTKKANDITTEYRSEVTKLTRSVQELATREQDRTRAERERAAAAAATASGRR